MASLPAAGMTSLGQSEGIHGYDSTKIIEAFAEIENAKFAPRLAKPKRHDVKSDSPQKIHVLDLNIKELSNTMGKHLLDLIHDYDGPLDVPAICTLLKDNNYESLPAPFKEKQATHQLYQMQVNMHKQRNNKWRIVKWIIFEEKQIFDNIKDHFIYGKACQPTWTSPAFISHVMKVLQLLFERLPGTSMLYLVWASDNPKQNSLDNDGRRAGYNYIKTRGPRANNLNQFVEWTDIEVNKTDSPIYGWSEGRVKESLCNYAKGASAAKTIER